MTQNRITVGSEIDGFTARELLHKGGMAHLWTVTREGDSRLLLMKVPILKEGEDPASIVSFEMEQMIMPRLSGPHVPRFIANGGLTVQPYIVMERLPGSTLLSRLEDLPMKVEEAAEIGAKVADALESLHRQKLVHLDVKPSNIMFRETGEAVLIDFGLSRHRELPDLMAEEFRLPYGTAPYMAPEQVMGIRNDPRSDVFALGAMLYLFATNERPFGDPQRMRGLKKRLWRDPKPPRAINANIPPWFQEVILSCLEVNAGRRPQTAAQLAFLLRNPQSVELTARAGKLTQDSFFTVLKRRSEPAAALIARPPDDSEDASAAPIIAVAINLEDAPERVSVRIRETAKSLLARAPDARLAVINVQKLARFTIDRSLDEDGTSIHLQRLVELKDWARPFELPQGRVTFHVIESVDPAEAILEFVRMNTVDHLVMGARANSTMRKILGSVSGKVAAEAPCTVTVVRHRGLDNETEEDVLAAVERIKAAEAQ